MKNSLKTTIKKLRILTLMLSAVLIIFIWGCGGKSDQNNTPQSDNQQSASQNNSTDASGLTPFQLKNGIGPITEPLKLGPIDPALVKKGEKIFKTKCSACHRLDERYVGPAQRNLVERRSPEYIINMMMNPSGMLAQHPEAKKLLAQYMTPMPNQNLTIDDAKALLDFFRKVDEDKTMDKD